jgi:hypothetical protein
MNSTEKLERNNTFLKKGHVIDKIGVQTPNKALAKRRMSDLV